mgnify:CR=1 FL=1
MADLIPWDPWREFVERELAEVRDAFDRFWGRRMMRRRPEFGAWGEAWAPAVDVYDRGDSLVVKAELPGVDKDEVDITLSEDALTIRGETRRDEEVKERDYYRRERVYGSFVRTIPLPVAVEQEGVKANFKNGVLEVVLPKAKGAGRRETKIQIE